jgi:hypothetical protein
VHGGGKWDLEGVRDVMRELLSLEISATASGTYYCTIIGINIRYIEQLRQSRVVVPAAVTRI